jgi:hypothetical protein
MWFIKSKFVGDQDTFTEELESATDIKYVEMKYHRRVSKWYDIVMENGYFTGDAELKLRIIETILKYKNEQDGKNRSFVIEKYEQ